MQRLLYILLIGLTLLACQGEKSPSSPSAETPLASVPPIDTMAEVVKRVRQQSRLYATEVIVHKVVLYNDEARLGGALFDLPIPGDRKVAIPLDVTLKGYIDFGEFSSHRVRLVDSLVILTLPDPRITITAAKIDHAKVRQFVSFNRSNFSDDEIASLAHQGEDSILHHIGRYNIVETTRESAVRTLRPLLRRMGFQENNIIIRFRKDFTEREIQKFVTRPL